MAYKVLYRKYRPSTFENIVGQRNIVETLKQSVENSSFSHAYIFTGPRGTGKTSTAKVLAKAINCEHNINGEACNECDNCKNFATSPDIIEIDAASNNGVDEIRELRSNVTLAPAASKYKIYIIDEVHMLSPGAFNALLKTLEEPPSHVIFILATTEIYKVPITILSRCQRFDFKKIDHEDMVSHLKMICEKENITVEDQALEEIYSLSEGCMRDALSIMDQTSKISSSLTLNDIFENYNVISKKTIEELLDLTFNNDISNLINKLNEIQDSGINAQKMIKKIMNYLETILIDIRMGKEKKYKYDKIKQLMISLNECYVEARNNENVYTMIKLSFLDLIDNTKTNINKSQQKQSDLQEEKISENTLTVKDTNPKSIIDIRINNCFVDANKESLSKISNIWSSLEEESIQSIKISDYVPRAASEDYIIFESEEDSLAELFNIKFADIENNLKNNGLISKVVAISSNRWNEEKEKYKQNIRKKKKYELIAEPEKIENNSKIKGKADDLFNDKLVEIS